MQLLRRQFGIAEPVRRGMELKIAREGEWRPRMLGYASTVSSDILAGRDEEVGWEDIFVGTFIRLYTAMDDLLAMMEANIIQAMSSEMFQTSTPRWRAG